MASDRARLMSVLESMTKPKHGHLDLDPMDMRFVKRLARRSPDNVKTCYTHLMSNLLTANAQVRYLCLLLVDILFMRSKYFRILLTQGGGLNTLVEFTVGDRIGNPLPDPEDVAERLRSHALECLERWKNVYGDHYNQLRVAYQYLKHTKHFKFPEVRQQQARQREEQQQRERRAQERAIVAFKAAKRDAPSLYKSIDTSLREARSLLELIIPPIDDEDRQRKECEENDIDDDMVAVGACNTSSSSTSSSASSSNPNSRVQEALSAAELGMISNSFTLEISMSPTLNEEEVKQKWPLLSAMRDVMLQSHHQLKTLNEWERVLVRVDLSLNEDKADRDNMMRTITSYRGAIRGIQSSWTRLTESLPQLSTTTTRQGVNIASQTPSSIRSENKKEEKGEDEEEDEDMWEEDLITAKRFKRG